MTQQAFKLEPVTLTKPMATPFLMVMVMSWLKTTIMSHITTQAALMVASVDSLHKFCAKLNKDFETYELTNLPYS